MRKEHFTKANLFELPSCFLDPKGNLIFLSGTHETGIHEELAAEILDKDFGESFVLDNYWKVKDNRTYLYEYLEEVEGYFRYSHWVGEHGVFNGEASKLTHAQKLAIREFCKVNGTTWDKVYQGE